MLETENKQAWTSKPITVNSIQDLKKLKDTSRIVLVCGNKNGVSGTLYKFDKYKEPDNDGIIIPHPKNKG